MADLRITGVANNQLELQAPDGTRHYLDISDDLLKALKSREVSLPQSVTPRDIQQQVRLGASIEEVVRETGADADLVTKFARPIIAELNHIVELAKNIRISLAGDRFAEPTLVEFGSIMDERLLNNGAKNISWKARKSTEGDWLVSIGFDTNQGHGIATWSFDPKQLFLAPENEAALQLSNGVPVSAVSKTVQLTQEAQEPQPIVEVESEIVPERTVSLTVVPEVVDEPEDPETNDLFEEPFTGANLTVVEEIVEIEEEFYEEPTTADEVVEVQSEPEQAQAEPNKEEASKPQTNSRWAEVLFGSKEDEEETF